MTNTTTSPGQINILDRSILVNILIKESKNTKKITALEYYEELINKVKAL